MFRHFITCIKNIFKKNKIIKDSNRKNDIEIDFVPYPKRPKPIKTILKINKKEYILNFEKEVKDILLSYVDEINIIIIISNYTLQTYPCYNCKKIFDEDNIFYYNIGDNVIIHQCFKCANKFHY